MRPSVTLPIDLAGVVVMEAGKPFEFLIPMRGRLTFYVVSEQMDGESSVISLVAAYGVESIESVRIEASS